MNGFVLIVKVLGTRNTIYWYFQFTKIHKVPNPHFLVGGN